MDQSEFLHFDVTGKILGAAHRVHGKLGAGFPREFYQNALTHELTQKESCVSQSHPIRMSYDSAILGDWHADLLVDNSVVLVITADKTLNPILEATLLNVLKASEFEVGVLLNFGEKLEFKRKVHGNGNKPKD